MLNLIVFDTDILIDAGRGIDKAVDCLKYYESNNQLATSIITKMELVVGCRNKKELRNVERFLIRFQLLNITENISTIADELLLKYRLSHTLLIADAFIAATAINWKCPLILKNQCDYRFIDKLDLLSY